jgi:hypothetical protein
MGEPDDANGSSAQAIKGWPTFGLLFFPLYLSIATTLLPQPFPLEIATDSKKISF